MDLTKLLSERTRRVESSGIRKFFDLAGKITNPCDFSIGMPDYDAPESVKAAAIEAIRAGKNRYTPSGGLAPLRERILSDLRNAYSVEPGLLVTSGVSGGLTLALLALINPGDEVLFLDPYFVSYMQLVNMTGGKPVPIPSYPAFQFDGRSVEAAITPRTKAMIINSPGNPTGRVMTEAEMREASRIAQKHGIILISDEIYDRLCYDGPNPCPLSLAPDNTLLLRGFGKTYGITGWRMGYAAGPPGLIAEMTKLHQFTYVCAPSMAQEATIAALDTDTSLYREAYAKKRDLVCKILSPYFRFERPSGGLYVFPEAPARFDGATAFAEAAMRESVIVIPGIVFSGRDTHFRLSYAASDDVLRRGCEALCRLATGR